MEHDDSAEGETTYLVGRTRLQAALIAAFVATYIATISGIWFYGVKLPVFNFPQLNGYIIMGITAPNSEVLTAGWIAQTIQGVLFALIFAFVVHPILGHVVKPLRPLTPVNNVIKGVIFGFALYIISAAAWVPLLIGPLLAPFNVPVGGFLSTFGPYGWQANVTDLLWHMVYGVNLGLLFMPLAWVAARGASSTPASTSSIGGVRMDTSLLAALGLVILGAILIGVGWAATPAASLSLPPVNVAGQIEIAFGLSFLTIGVGIVLAWAAQKALLAPKPSPSGSMS